MAAELNRHLRPLHVSAEFRTATGFDNRTRTVVVTTPHSFKGYEAEVVWVAGLDLFHHGGKPAAAPMYVALTRARSLLVASGTRTTDAAGRALMSALSYAGDLSATAPSVGDGAASLRVDTMRRLEEQVGPEHKAWLAELARLYDVTVEPVESAEGEILAEPLFVARHKTDVVAYFTEDKPPSKAEVFRLYDAGVRIQFVGARL